MEGVGGRSYVTRGGLVIGGCDVMCVGGRCCVVLTLWWDKLRVMWLPPPRAHHDVVMTYEGRDRFFIHLQGETFEQVDDDV